MIYQVMYYGEFWHMCGNPPVVTNFAKRRKAISYMRKVRRKYPSMTTLLRGVKDV